MGDTEATDNWLTRRLANLLRAMPMTNDPDGVRETLRRHGLEPSTGWTPPSPSIPSQPANDPSRMLFISRTWRELTRQLAARQAARRR